MNIGAWIKGHKPEAALGAGGIAVTVLLALRTRKKAGAGSGAPASGVAYPASSIMPVTTADTTASDAYSGIESQVVGLQSALLALQHPDPSSSGPAGAPSGGGGTGPAPTPGMGEVDTALGPMIWLGVTGPGGSTAGDFQVGGGAPVFFGNASSLAQGGTQAAGVDVYTPVNYAGQVSAKAGA